ncbi:hypothetical protein [Spiroplasma monobiae]|uniref:LD-carboxypeptidase C-terminal domain-containing protein n=1 Tax=Spiroplasma monobiae MQ-1 TaxID=1336748 RepID=A0A2K9LW82_SPISQ|nr:hypothetical protein [Spiroplasma monobiae]AUM62645.1 hypothetical protein SMONO_v1c03960 [Spiroplasma monobiae MQ-1]
MKIAAFNIIDSIEESDINDFKQSVEFFQGKGFNVLVPNDSYTENKEQEIKEDFERLIDRKPLIAIPTFCKKNEINFIKKVNWKKISKSQTIFCGNSFVTPFLNSIIKFTNNTVLYGPNFISNFNLDSKETIYIDLIQKSTKQNKLEELNTQSAKFFGKKVVKGNLVGGEINSYIEMYSTGYINKVSKKDVLLIDGIFETKKDVEEVIEKLTKLKIINKLKAIIICESVMENQELLESFLLGFKKIAKANLVAGIKGMMSEDIEIVKLNREVIIDFKNNKITQ